MWPGLRHSSYRLASSLFPRKASRAFSRAQFHSMADLERAAVALAEKGPHKYEPTPKRIRVQLGKKIIFDALDVQLVWEHPFYGQYYFRSESLKDATLSEGREVDGAKGFKIHDVTADDKTVKDAMLTIETGPLTGLMRPDINQMDAYFEEDDVIHSHPVDPYKRVDTRRSSRPIRVEVDGIEVANAPWSVHLYETGLPVRYYLPRTAVEPEVLQKSDFTTYCPYKGTSKYYSVVPEPGAKLAKDIVWYYEQPYLESIKELVCFYNEKVDIWIDGVKQPRPKNPWG